MLNIIFGSIERKVRRYALRGAGAIVALLVLLSFATPVVRAQCPTSGTNTINWTTGDGNWSDASQWTPTCSPNNAPPAYFNVNIIGSGSDTVTLDTSPTIDSLALGSGETLTDNGVAQSLTIGSSNSGNSLDATLNNAGIISLSASGSTLTIDGSAFSSANINATNTGSINLSNGASLVLNDSGNSNAFFFNTSGNSGSINLNGGNIMAATGDEQMQSYTTINSAGSSLINLDLINNAAVNVTSGTLTIQPTGASANPGIANTGSGTMTVSSGATLLLEMSQFQGTGLNHPGAAFYNAGAVMINDGGTLQWDNPTGNYAYISNDGTITLGSSTGANLQLSGGGTFDVGSLAGTGQIVMNGNSSIMGAGSETLINDFGHTISTNGTNTLSSLTLYNYGTLQVVTGSTLDVTAATWGDLDGSGNLTDGGTYNMYGGVLSYTGGDILNNVNTYLALADNGGLATDAIGSNVQFTHDGGVTSALDNLNTNSGVLSLTTGIVQNLNGGLLNTGILFVQNGSSMTTNCNFSSGCSSPLSTGGDLTNGGNTGSGTVLLYNGGGGGATLTVNGNYEQNSTTLQNLGNTLTVTGNFTNDNYVQVDIGNAINVAGGLTNVDGTNTLNSGTYNLNGGTFFYNGNPINTIGNGASITLGYAPAGGATDVNGSSLLISNDGGTTSALDNLNTIASGGSLSVNNSAIQNIQGSLTNNGLLGMYMGTMTIGNGGNGSLTNTGTVQLSFGSKLTLNITGAGAGANVAQTNSGTGGISINQSALELQDGGNQSAFTFTSGGLGGAITLTNGLIATDTGDELMVNGTGPGDQTIQGSGIIIVDLINNDTVIANGPLDLQPTGHSSSPGVLNNGTMQVNGGSTLYWDATAYTGSSLSTPAFNNQGTVNVSGAGGGYLEFQAPVNGTAYFNNDGSIIVGVGGPANLVLAGAGSTFDLGSAGGTGTLTLNQSNIYGFNGTETLINDTGHTLIANGFSPDSFIYSANFTNNGMVTVNGGLVIQPGVNASTGVINNGAMQVAGSGVLYWDTTNGFGAAGDLGTSVAAPAFNNQGTVTVSDGGYLTLIAPASATAYFNNDGNITIGSSTGAALALDGSGATFDLGSVAGTGELTLNYSTIYGYNGNETLINDTGHTIQGTGVIENLKLVNNGTIDANGGSGLHIYTGTTNTGLLEATNNGVLQLYNINVNNAGGNITANGGGATVEVYDSTIQGGTLNTLGGGTLESVGYSVLDGSTGSGAIHLSSGSTYTTAGTSTYVLGAINNQGNFQVNGGGGVNSYLYTSGNTTLTGGGTLTLSTTTAGGGGNAWLYQNGAFTLDNVNNTIQGEGYIYNNGAAIINEVGGIISANSTGSPLITPLYLEYGNITNKGLLEATNSGVLQLFQNTVNNAGGNITANGANATVQVYDTTIQGGTLNNKTGGTMESIGYAVLDGSTASGAINLTSGSTYLTPGGSQTYILGAINNQGNFQVNGGGGSNTYLYTAGNTTLTGGGTLTLSTTTVGGGGNAWLYQNGPYTLDNVNNTIQGEGYIYNNGATIINEVGALINANSTGSPLVSTLEVDYGTITNKNVLEATNNGVLQLFQNTINNAGGGQITASGSGAAVNLYDTTVQGGTLNNNTGGTMQSIGYAVLDGSTGSGAINLSSGSTYLTAAGSQTDILGAIKNQGNFQVNGGGGYNTYIYTVGNTTLTGGGTLTLSTTTSGGGGNAYLQQDGPYTLDNVNNTIQGEGIIYNNGATIINEVGGTINANSAGSPLISSLTLYYGSVDNTGLMEATNNGTLQLNDTTVNNAGGNITANGAGATVQFANSTTVEGGTLNTLNGGTLGTAFGNTVYLDGATEGALTLSAGSTYTVAPDADTSIKGTIINQGNFQVNGGGGFNTYLEVSNNTTTLQGGGTVTLSTTTSGGGGNAQLYFDGGATLNNVNNTIRGEGVIYNNGAILNNEASGTINANSTGSPLINTLTLYYGSVNNTGLMEATNNGVLQLNDTTVNNAGGNITANGAGATVQIANSTTVQGGILNTLNGGTLGTAFANTVYLDGAAHGALTLSSGSTYTLAPDSDTYITGTINNQGNFQVNGGGGFNTYLEVPNNTTTLQGGGTVTLSTTTTGGGGNAQLYLDGGATLNNVNNTIQGEGVIYNGGAAFNNEAGGTINANSTGSPLINGLTLQSGTFTNAGLMEATNNGVLQLNDTTVNNAGGNITANGAGATVQITDSATVQGGTLNTLNGGTLGTAFANTVYLDGAAHGALTLSSGSTYTVAPDSDTYITGTINNQGTFLVNGGGGFNTYLEVHNGTTTLRGGGTVTLSTAAGGGTAQLYLDGGTTLNNVNNTIQGVGTINTSGASFNNSGTIIAGTPGNPGTLTINGNYNQTGSGIYDELISNSANGLLNISGGITLGSGSGTTLDISLLNTYDPTNGTSFTIVTDGSLTSGSFNINPADLYFGTGDDQTWLVSYGTNDIVLTAEANTAGTVVATWNTGTGTWINASEWSCTPGPATCVPENGNGTVYDTVLNSGGNTLTLPTGNNITVDTLALEAGTLDIQTGATLNLANQPNGLTDIAAGSGLIVAGTFTAGSNSALAALNSVEGYLELEGQNITSTPGSGTLTVASGAQAYIYSGTSLTVNGNLANSGDTRVNGGSTLAVNGNLTNSGDLYTGVGGGAANTLNVTGAFTNNAGAATYISFSNTSADIANVGSLTNNGYLNIGTNGTLNITGGGQGLTDVVAGSDLILYGTVNVINGATTSNGLGNLTSVEGYAELDNAQTTATTPNGGTLNVSSTGDLRVNYGSTLNVTGAMTNSGDVYTGVGGGAANTLTVTGAYTNNGLTWVGYSNTSDIANVNSLTNNGELAIGSNATMNITGGGQGITDVVAGSSLYLYGTLNVINGATTSNGLGHLTSVEGYAELDNAQATATTPIGGTLNVASTGDLRVNNGSTLTVAGNLTNSGVIYTGVGYTAGNTLNVTGAFTNNSGANTYVGWSNVSADHMNVGSLANAGYIQVNSGSTLNIAGSIDTNSGNVTLYGGTLSSPSAGGNFDNTGTVKTYAGGPAGTVAIGGTFTNELGANLTLNNSGDVATIGNLANGGTASVAAGALLGVGTGTFTAPSGYQQLANGTLTELISSASSFGVLNITGSASLAGALAIGPLNFNPNGDTFDILNFTGTLTGAFSNGPNFSADGYNWSLIYNANDVQLTAGVIPTMVAATWSTNSGNWTNPAEWNCNPTYSPCVPNNNNLTAFTAEVNSPGNTLTLDNTSNPTTVNINSLSLVAGTLDIGTGTTLNLVSQPGGLTDIADGTGLIVAGTFTAGANSALANLASVEGTLTLANGQTTSVTPGGGTLTVSGFDGQLNVQQGSTLAVTGNLNNSADIELGGAGDPGHNTLTVSGLLTNSGFLNVNSTGDSVTATNLSNTGNLTLARGTSLLVTSNWNNLDGSGNLTGGGSYDVSGTFQYASPANGITSIANGVSVYLRTGGFITYNGTNDSLAGLTNNAGIMEFDGVTELITPVGGTLTNSTTNPSLPAELALVDSANVTVHGNFDNGSTGFGLVQLGQPVGGSPSTLTITGNTTNEQDITLSSADTFATNGTLYNSGYIDMTGANGTVTVGGALTNHAGVILLTGANTSLAAASINNVGAGNIQLNGNGANMTVTGGISSGGTVQINANNNSVSVGGDFINNNGTILASGTNGSISVTGAVTNTFGTVTLSGNGDTLSAASFSNAGGTVTVGHGESLDVATSYTQTSGSTEINGTLTSNGNDVSIEGGTLAGGGKIFGDVTNNGGTVTASDPFASPDLLTIYGDYMQGAGGTLDALLLGTLPGTDYSQLDVNGTATLDGTLDVNLENNFVPTVGENFFLVDSTNPILGSFATLDLPTLAAGDSWEVLYNHDCTGGCVDLTVEGPATTPEPSVIMLLAMGIAVMAILLKCRNTLKGSAVV